MLGTGPPLLPASAVPPLLGHQWQRWQVGAHDAAACLLHMLTTYTAPHSSKHRCTSMKQSSHRNMKC